MVESMVWGFGVVGKGPLSRLGCATQIAKTKRAPRVPRCNKDNCNELLN